MCLFYLSCPLSVRFSTNERVASERPSLPPLPHSGGWVVGGVSLNPSALHRICLAPSKRNRETTGLFFFLLLSPAPFFLFSYVSFWEQFSAYILCPTPSPPARPADFSVKYPISCLLLLLLLVVSLVLPQIYDVLVLLLYLHHFAFFINGPTL